MLQLVVYLATVVKSRKKLSNEQEKGGENEGKGAVGITLKMGSLLLGKSVCIVKCT